MEQQQVEKARFYTAKEAAIKLRVPLSTFHRRAQKGKYPTRVRFPTASRYLYPVADIDSLADEIAHILGEDA